MLAFPYNIESIIDDWVLMGFLVGNDFIPHLPNFHITTNALPFLYQTYIHVLPKLDGYLNDNGVVNLKRFQSYLEALYDVSSMILLVLIFKPRRDHLVSIVHKIVL